MLLWSLIFTKPANIEGHASLLSARVAANTRAEAWEVLEAAVLCNRDGAIVAPMGMFKTDVPQVVQLEFRP